MKIRLKNIERVNTHILRNNNLMYMEDCVIIDEEDRYNSVLLYFPISRIIREVDSGGVDMHKLLHDPSTMKKYGHDPYSLLKWFNYDFIYTQTNLDLIRWEIENNLFNWDKHSEYIPEYVPDLFDPDKFNWSLYSDIVLEHTPEYFDPDRFDWDTVPSYMRDYYTEFTDGIVDRNG